MGLAGYTVKLEQWEEEDRQLAAAGIPNPNDSYPDDHSNNWLRARSKLVIKDRVSVIVFNNKEVEKLAAKIKEKIACAESLGMAGQREYDVLSQFLGRPEQPDRVCGVSSYQDWKYVWPQHVEMYRKRKMTKTDASVDTERIKEQIKQELLVEMQMQNMQMQRWCCHQMVLSPMSNRASPSPATLKSSYASTDNVGLIDGTAELATDVY
jgi:DNA-directed RNA polymerase subunit N (RpoN/RPB10)